jgi:hypothetical protein
MKKNKAAQELSARGWKKKTKEQKIAHIKMMNAHRLAKMKKASEFAGEKDENAS